MRWCADKGENNVKYLIKHERKGRHYEKEKQKAFELVPLCDDGI